MIGKAIHRVQSAIARERERRTRQWSRQFLEAAQDRRALAFHTLTPTSLAFASVHPSRDAVPEVCLVLPDARPSSLFAGVRTALQAGVLIARQRVLPLTVFSLTPLGAGDETSLQSFVRREFGEAAPQEIRVHNPQDAIGYALHPSTVVLATHWLTAHAIDVACNLDLIDRTRVIYLIQDFEPGFLPWSDDSAVSESTYDAGFGALVNSSPLAEYLRHSGRGEIFDDRAVFGPELDWARLEEAARSREDRDIASIVFYARPDKPRNLFKTGVAALELAAMRSNFALSTFGSAHPRPSGRAFEKATIHGKLSWGDYFTVLAASDVVLSLQMSPHPSHPPLEAVVSGAFAVTNEFAGGRSALHPRLLTAAPAPAPLADVLATAVDSALSADRTYDDSWTFTLGRPLNEAVQYISEKVTR